MYEIEVNELVHQNVGREFEWACAACTARAAARIVLPLSNSGSEARFGKYGDLLVSASNIDTAAKSTLLHQ
jgi:hypothetical protein